MIATLRALYGLLTRHEQKRYVLLAALMTVVGAFEALGVASVLPFLAVLSDPSVIETNPILTHLYAAGGFANHTAFLFALGLGCLALLLASLAGRALATYAMHRFTQLRNYTISARLLRGYLAKPYVWFLSRHSSDFAKDVMYEVEEAVVGALTASLRLIVQSATFVCIVAVVLWANPVAALAAGGVVASTYVAVVLAVRTVMLRLGAERLAANQARFHALQETIGAIKDIKVLGLEERSLQSFEAPALRFARRQARFKIMNELPRFALEGIAFGSMIVFLLILLATTPGGVSAVLPQLGLLALAGIKLLPAAQQIFLAVSSIRYFTPSIQKVVRDAREIAAEKAAAVPASEGPPLSLNCRLALKGVTYTFPDADRPAVNNLTLTIKAGTTVAFIGETGAGKSTAVDLIMGLLTPERGTIAVDGTPIGPHNLRAWQRAIGYVPQAIFLVDGTIEDNIALGVPHEDVNPAALERAARIAAIHDTIIARPGRYQSRVGERGAKLSGGQRQRIGIARALYHDPKILVLDEATSALDTKTEKAVMDALEALQPHKTILTITHRPNALSRTNTVYRFSAGVASVQTEVS